MVHERRFTHSYVIINEKIILMIVILNQHHPGRRNWYTKLKRTNPFHRYTYSILCKRRLGFLRAKSKSHNIVLISWSLSVGRVHNNRGFRIIPKRLVGAEWLRTDYTPQGDGRVCHSRREVLAGDNDTRVPLVGLNISTDSCFKEWFLFWTINDRKSRAKMRISLEAVTELHRNAKSAVLL